MRRRALFLFSILCLVLLIPSVNAQDITPIAYGDTVSGQAVDLQTLNFYSFSGQAGDTITITLTSDVIDTYLILGDSNGNSLAENDDISTSDYNSRIDFTLPAAGTYIIGATGYSAGPYTLSLIGPSGGSSGSQNLGAAPIAYGDTLGGQAEGSSVYDYYSFQGNAGDQVVVNASSNLVDPFIQLGDTSGNVLGFNDDISISDLNAQIEFTLPASGEYLITVSAYSAGPYSLSLTNANATAAPAEQLNQIAYGQAVSGTITDPNQMVIYTFQGSAGDNVVIEVASDQIDPYAVLGDVNGNSLANNDDISASDLNSFLAFTLPANGDYLIGVGGYSAGNYNMALSLGSADVPTTTTTQEPVGSVFTGTISNEEPFVIFPITSVAANSTITIDARATSGDLDTYVALALGDQLVAENDDRESGDTNSFLQYPASTPGDYNLIVTRYNFEEGESTGSFEVTVDVSASDQVVFNSPTGTTNVPDPSASGYPALAASNRAEWTVLAYLGGDNNLEGALMNDLNEFELAGGSNETVRVVTLMDRSPEYDTSNGDWRGVQIFEIGADSSADERVNFPPTFDSTMMANLGDLDTSYPNNLTDFLIWGIQTYPANHYAVILNDHGGAWYGIVTDDSAGGGILGIPDLQQAFSTALQATGLSKFDVLINDACLMSGIEYYAAMSPYFDYSVGSPEITMGIGFDMTTLTQTLNQNPNIDIGQMGQILMDKYLADVHISDPDLAPVLTGAVTDLRNFDPVVQAVNEFVRIVNSNPDAYASIIGEARSNAYSYTFFYPEDVAGPPTNMDIGHFMKHMMRLTNDPQIQAAAQAVLSALDNALIYGTSGDELTDVTSFYNIYFPANSAYFSPQYMQDSPLQSWGQLLTNYYSAINPAGRSRFRGATPIPNAGEVAAASVVPEVAITNVYPQVASAATPTIISMEVTGRNISHGEFTVDQIQADGRTVRLDRSRIVTNVVIDNVAQQINQWTPGVDDSDFTWEVTLPVLTDGTTTNNELIVYENEITSMAGRYRFPDSETWLDVTVIFNDDGNVDSVLNLQPETNSLAALSPVAGGEFQAYRSVVTADGRVVAEPGNIYTWGNLHTDRMPAPSGQYNLGFQVTAFGGSTGFASVPVAVDNTNLNADLRGYMDIDWGFNLLYPFDWSDVRYFPDSQYLQAANDDRSRFVFVYPTFDGQTDLQAIATSALGRFGLTPNQDFTPVTIAGREAVEFTFDSVNDDQPYAAKAFAVYMSEVGVGLVFSTEVLDPATLEESYVVIRDNVSFFDAAAVRDQDTGVWARQTLGDLVRFPVPGEWFVYDGDPWKLYTPEEPDAEGFVATAVSVGQFPGATDAKAKLNELLAEYVAIYPGYELTSTDIYYGENHTWETGYFHYTSTTGREVTGRMHVTVVDGTAYALWFEAPPDTFSDLSREFYDVVLDGFRVQSAE